MGREYERKENEEERKQRKKYVCLDIEKIRGKKSYVLYKMTYISLIIINMSFR